jgi:hypothetical protein
MTSEWYTGIKLEMCIHPNSTCLDLPRHTVRSVKVFRPDRRTKTHLRVIGLLNGICLVAKGEERNDWTYRISSVGL